jgi:hypothetical protein
MALTSTGLTPNTFPQGPVGAELDPTLLEGAAEARGPERLELNASGLGGEVRVAVELQLAVRQLTDEPLQVIHVETPGTEEPVTPISGP